MILEEEVEKIRAVRQRLSAGHGHDLSRLLEHYQRLSEELRISGQFRFAKKPAKSAPARSVKSHPRIGSRGFSGRHKSRNANLSAALHAPFSQANGRSDFVE